MATARRATSGIGGRMPAGWLAAGVALSAVFVGVAVLLSMPGRPRPAAPPASTMRLADGATPPPSDGVTWPAGAALLSDRAPTGAGPAPATARRASPGPASAAASAPTSKWAQVNALVSSGRPADLFAAYRILSLCAVVQALQEAEDANDATRREDRSKVDEQCGDLSPGQLGGRVRLLEAAADAHVPGAVAALKDQGPDGQPAAEVWDDPAYADWRQRTVERIHEEAARGDAVALQLMVAEHDHGQRPLAVEDSAAALKYETAYVDVQLAMNPAFASTTRRESLGLQVKRLAVLYGDSLTPEQFAAALADGHALAAQAIAQGTAASP